MKAPLPSKKAADVTAKLTELKQRLRKLTAPVRAFSPRAIEPMLASIQDTPPLGPGWIFEIKYDGVRVLAERKDKDVELYGRNGTVITNRYPELCHALGRLIVDRFVIDGEIVACDEQGRPSFQKLQARMHLTRARDIEQATQLVPVEAIFFDCLALEGHDLRALSLLQRKTCLENFLPPAGLLRYSDHIIGNGTAFLAAASAHGLEGIVAKRADASYHSGRTHHWLKIKCYRTEEFVIGGYTDPQGGRGRFGALHLGMYRDEKLIYISKVGSGFDAKSLEMVWRKMQPLTRVKSPFQERSPAGRGHHWVEPQLVCAVRFSDWTADGGIRHPVFLGLRNDKKPEDCQKEELSSLQKSHTSPATE